MEKPGSKVFQETFMGQVDMDAGVLLYDDSTTNTPIGDMYDDEFLDLANYIILKAVEDFRYGYKQMLIMYKTKSKIPTKEEFERMYGLNVNHKAINGNFAHTIRDKMCLYYDALDFFESEWGRSLMRNIKVPIEDIVKFSEKQVEDRMDNMEQFKGRSYKRKHIVKMN